MPLGSVKNHQKDILVLENDLGDPCITIKADGSIDLSKSNDLDDQSLAFWESVAEFLPLDKSSIAKNKIALIKLYATLRDLRERIDFHDTKSRNAFDDIMEETAEIFNRAN